MTWLFHVLFVMRLSKIFARFKALELSRKMEYMKENQSKANLAAIIQFLDIEGRQSMEI